MNARTGIVMAGFLQLSLNERNEFIEELRRYLQANADEKMQMTENIEKFASVVLGPTTPVVCPCCGR